MINKIAKGSAAVTASATHLNGVNHRLRQVRESLEKSQQEMSEFLKIGKNSWQNYEGGRQVPGGRVIAALARHGFNAHWILTGEGEMRIEDKAEIDKLRQQLSDFSEENKRLLRKKQELERRMLGKTIDLEREFPDLPRCARIIPVLGLQDCGLQGWHKITNTRMYTEAPAEIAQESGIAIMAQGDTMARGGVMPGNLLLCDQGVPLRLGDTVFIENRDGYGIVAIYTGDTELDGDKAINLQCWLPSTLDDPLDGFFITVKVSDIKHQAPAIVIKRRV